MAPRAGCASAGLARSNCELAEKFLQQYPDTRCLFTSGYADDEVALYGVIQDRIAFLSKPYSPHDLLAKAREVLTAAEPQRPAS